VHFNHWVLNIVCSYSILAETIDRIVERDDALRAAIGMPDRSQNTGTPVLTAVTRRYALMLRFCTAVCAVLSCLLSCAVLFFLCFNFVTINDCKHRSSTSYKLNDWMPEKDASFSFLLF